MSGIVRFCPVLSIVPKKQTHPPVAKQLARKPLPPRPDIRRKSSHPDFASTLALSFALPQRMPQFNRRGVATDSSCCFVPSCLRGEKGKPESAPPAPTTQQCPEMSGFVRSSHDPHRRCSQATVEKRLTLFSHRASTRHTGHSAQPRYVCLLRVLFALFAPSRLVCLVPKASSRRGESGKPLASIRTMPPRGQMQCPAFSPSCHPRRVAKPPVDRYTARYFACGRLAKCVRVTNYAPTD